MLTSFVGDATKGIVACCPEPGPRGWDSTWKPENAVQCRLLPDIPLIVCVAFKAQILYSQFHEEMHHIRYFGAFACAHPIRSASAQVFASWFIFVSCKRYTCTSDFRRHPIWSVPICTCFSRSMLFCPHIPLYIIKKIGVMTSARIFKLFCLDSCTPCGRHLSASARCRVVQKQKSARDSWKKKTCWSRENGSVKRIPSDWNWSLCVRSGAEVFKALDGECINQDTLPHPI